MLKEDAASLKERKFRAMELLIAFSQLKNAVSFKIEANHSRKESIVTAIGVLCIKITEDSSLFHTFIY